MHRNEYEYYITYINKDIAQIAKHKIWERVNLNDIPPGTYVKHRHVLRGT